MEGRVHVVFVLRRPVRQEVTNQGLIIGEAWAKLRAVNDYENDFYYISQLYEENWMPQPTV